MRGIVIAGLALCIIGDRASAWSRPGHMVTAAIAYSDLANDPAVKSAIVELIEAHPDRAPFEVAIDRTVGEARARRLFYECARWPDDARGTAYDHPTWHYAARPVHADRGSNGSANRIEGSAIEAFALNFRVLADRRASKAERAVALCWVMHLVGDIHQPLHTAQLFSHTFPDGDQLGSKQFVRATPHHDPVTLHWFWDDRVHRSGTQDSVETRATEITSSSPRATASTHSADFALWAEQESYAEAVRLAYGKLLITSAKPADAPVLPQAYIDETLKSAEQRVALAGHRLASVLREALNIDRPRR